jgi:C-methyltransferase C-terminal domain/Methyltransferase domain
MQKDDLKNISKGVFEIFTQKKVPLFQNKVYPSESMAKISPQGEVRLVQSKVSGFVFNQAFDESLMNYDEHYHNEQSNSLFFRDHQQNIFNLISGFGLEGKKIAEIGCGKAQFFNILKSNNLECIGFDPAYEGDDPAIIKDYFSEKYKIDADVVILRHTLEHIANPHLFIQQIARTNNYKGHIFIEVPTFDWIVNKNAFWDIFYEHCNYFTQQSLGAMFESALTGELFEGQYIYCYAELKNVREEIPQEEFKPFTYISFLDSYKKWESFVSTNSNIVIWGAGAKGSTFLNLLDIEQEKIKAVIDINPEKQNKFIAVTGHPIYAPEKLTTLNCEHLIIMNENYGEEINEFVSKLKIRKPTILSL